MKRHGFTLIELMIVIAIIAVIAAIAIPGLLASQRASNERNASTSLKTITAAQADFRSNDRDGNHVNDFWTANLSGLYTMTSAVISGAKAGDTTDPSIKLIELSMAGADADGSTVAAGGENLALSNFAIPSAKAGYWYNALNTDATLTTTEATYRQDTGGTPTMGTVHNLWKFGFIAWPESMASGKYVYVVNENNTIYRSATSGVVRSVVAAPPGPATTPYDAFPSDAGLQSYWSKLD